jgi:hypothetical protein
MSGEIREEGILTRCSLDNVGSDTLACNVLVNIFVKVAKAELFAVG